MKFIQYRMGKGVYHIAYHGKNSCDGNYPCYGDYTGDKPPQGRLCARCKKKYLKTHTEEELFMEIL
jgi:hypothetical protein